MKTFSLILIAIVFFSCKNDKKAEAKESEVVVEKSIAKNKFPDNISMVFEAHGGFENWKSNRTLEFDIPSEKGAEQHTVDLYTRKDKVINGSVEMGYDGSEIWLLDTDKSYKGDAAFYHNLMFYFYAMPFVLSDNGIVYENTDAITYEGKTYPGVKIAFNDGVGASSKDNYYLHYDTDTHQMAWLGYTVTYRSGEKSDKVSWIRYNNWMEVEGVTLPKAISWHNFENGVIKEAKNTVIFENVSLSKKAKDNSYYAKPESAMVVSPKQN